MSKDNLKLGRSGEEAAIDFLKTQGYKILRHNFKTRLGEIDIIALDNSTICFVEVKTRRNVRFGLPQEAVSNFKRRHIQQAALVFLKENNLLDKKARFDVLSLLYEENKFLPHLIKNAFNLDEHFTI